MTGTALKLIAVIDPERRGELFGNVVVQSCSGINQEAFDILLITAMNDHATILTSLQRAGVPAEKIKFF